MGFGSNNLSSALVEAQALLSISSEFFSANDIASSRTTDASLTAKGVPALS